MALHTLNAAPGTAAWADCLHTVASGDALVLMGDGTYGALPGDDLEALRACGATLYILARDAEARGVEADLDALDMPGLVVLSEQHPQQVAWY